MARPGLSNPPSFLLIELSQEPHGTNSEALIDGIRPHLDSANVPIIEYRDDESTPHPPPKNAFIHVYNEGTREFEQQGFRDFLEDLDGEAMVRLIREHGHYDEARGNYQVNMGCNSGINWCNPGDDDHLPPNKKHVLRPDEYGLQLPQKSIIPEAFETSDVTWGFIKALNKFGEQQGLPAYREDFPDLCPRNHFLHHRFTNNEYYFPTLSQRGFENHIGQMAFGANRLATREEVIAYLRFHMDTKNCPIFKGVLTLSNIVLVDGELWRLSVIAYNKKAALDAWYRLQSLLQCGPIIRRYLDRSVGFTTPSMVSSRASDYHANFEETVDQLMILWNHVTQRSEGTLLCGTRGHLSKAMTYGQHVPLLITTLFGNALCDETFLELLIACAQTNSTEVQLGVLCRWRTKHNGLPPLRRGQSYVSMFVTEANQMFGGTNCGSTARAQLNVAEIKPANVRKLVRDLMKLRTQWSRHPPYPSTRRPSREELERAFKRVSDVVVNSSCNMGQLHSAPTLAALFGSGFLPYPELVEICPSGFDPKNDPVRLRTKDVAAKSRMISALARHFHLSFQMMENVLCEATRAFWPLDKRPPCSVMGELRNGTLWMGRAVSKPGTRSLQSFEVEHRRVDPLHLPRPGHPGIAPVSFIHHQVESKFLEEEKILGPISLKKQTEGTPEIITIIKKLSPEELKEILKVHRGENTYLAYCRANVIADKFVAQMGPLNFAQAQQNSTYRGNRKNPLHDVFVGKIPLERALSATGENADKTAARVSTKYKDKLGRDLTFFKDKYGVVHAERLGKAKVSNREEFPPLERPEQQQRQQQRRSPRQVGKPVPPYKAQVEGFHDPSEVPWNDQTPARADQEIKVAAKPDGKPIARAEKKPMGCSTQDQSSTQDQKAAAKSWSVKRTSALSWNDHSPPPEKKPRESIHGDRIHLVVVREPHWEPEKDKFMVQKVLAGAEVCTRVAVYSIVPGMPASLIYGDVLKRAKQLGIADYLGTHSIELVVDGEKIPETSSFRVNQSQMARVVMKPCVIDLIDLTACQDGNTEDEQVNLPPPKEEEPEGVNFVDYEAMLDAHPPTMLDDCPPTENVTHQGCDASVDHVPVTTGEGGGGISSRTRGRKGNMSEELLNRLPGPVRSGDLALTLSKGDAPSDIVDEVCTKNFPERFVYSRQLNMLHWARMALLEKTTKEFTKQFDSPLTKDACTFPPVLHEGTTWFGSPTYKPFSDLDEELSFYGAESSQQDRVATKLCLWLGGDIVTKRDRSFHAFPTKKLAQQHLLHCCFWCLGSDTIKRKFGDHVMKGRSMSNVARNVAKKGSTQLSQLEDNWTLLCARRHQPSTAYAKDRARHNINGNFTFFYKDEEGSALVGYVDYDSTKQIVSKAKERTFFLRI